MINSGRDWNIYDLQNPEGLIDLKSVGVNFVDNEVGMSDYYNFTPKNQFMLSIDDAELLHVGFEKGIIINGAKLQPIKLTDNFTVQVIVKPFSAQKQYAAIIGNHPGDKNYSGFIIQQNDKSTNNYYFSFGNGDRWSDKYCFSLSPDKWSYITVVYDSKMHHVMIYVNGKLMIMYRDVVEKYRNSSQPVYVGNWIGGDRQFNGLISEIEVTGRLLAASEIMVNYDKIFKEIPK